MSKRVLEEACIKRFGSLRPQGQTPETRRSVRRWFEWYNQERPHKALGCKSSRELRSEKFKKVA